MKPFSDLTTAGRELAARLENFRNVDDILVLGIASGGVPVAREVAVRLAAPMDLVVISRLLMPSGAGFPICATNVAGTLVLEDEVPRIPPQPQSPLDHFLTAAIADLEERARICRGSRPALELTAKTIILVDCGIRSGSSMNSAIRALRTREPRRIIAAVPVASITGGAVVQKIADEYVCDAHPEPFGNVGVWYKDFTRPGDAELGRLINSNAEQR